MKQWIVSSVAAAFLLLASIVHAGQEPDAIRDADIPAANAKGLIYTKEGKTAISPWFKTGTPPVVSPAAPEPNYESTVTLAGCYTTSQTTYSTSDLPYGYSVVAYGPYTVNCSGYQTSNVSKLNNGGSTNVYLQKLNGSTWTNYATGYTNISVSVPAGTYRFVIYNYCCGSPLQWKLTVNRTL